MHPEHLLTLHARPDTACRCDVRGMLYQCRTCGFDLHPLCSLVRPQPAQRANRGGGLTGFLKTMTLMLLLGDDDDDAAG
ncbi:hypothetical protein OPV22_008322 [Ensete ventricosum]|uniref:DC1 domain-containing protein n=1 Tax=Ensete ventricosum TaxID=4639 RepID=A0AAV8PNZ0_ENSVE|nr:hypothetical protein OPV22_008322 [Ensete ventricosum]